MLSKRYKQYECDARILQLFGLRRSGNHALLSWIMSKIEGRVLHLNEVTCARPYQCFWRARARGFDKWELRRKALKIHGRGGVNRYVLKHFVGRITEWQNLTVEELDPAVATLPKDALLLSYEDWELDHPKLPRLLRPTERGSERGTQTHRLILVRDPFNLFASLLYSERMTERNSGYYTRAWKQYAREYLQETDHLGAETLRVRYDEWRDSPAERARLCRELGIPEEDSAFTEVPKTGGGSSFDGVADDARNLNTDERWKRLRDDAFYKSLFDDEIRSLSHRIFGSAPF